MKIIINQLVCFHALVLGICTADVLYTMIHEEPIQVENEDESRASKELDDKNSSPNNIRFNIPDLNVKHNVNGVNVALQAYKVENRDHNNQWVSIGHPFLLKNDSGEIYEYNAEKIFLHLRLLADDQELALIQAAKNLYPEIKQAYIHLIPLQSVTCKTSFISNDDLIELQGNAYNLNQYEITVHIPCPEKSSNREAFYDKIKQQNPIHWICTFTADGKEKFVNRIKISAEDIQDAAIDTDLFGPANETFVTRNQLTLFAQEIRNNLQVEEDYEFDDKFNEKLVERLITIGSAAFEYVDIDKILAKLSKLGLSVNGQDLKPDEIKRLMTQNMSVIKRGDKHSLFLGNHEDNTDGEGKETKGGGGGELTIGPTINAGIVTIGPKFSAKGNGEVWKKYIHKWQTENSTIEDQLDEINKDDRLQVKYKFDGSKIIPKEVKVALLNKNAFSKNISISYKKIVRKDARYRKEILVTATSFVEDSTLKNFTKRLNTLEDAMESMKEENNRLINSMDHFSTVNADIDVKLTKQFDQVLNSINSISMDTKNYDEKLSLQLDVIFNSTDVLATSNFDVQNRLSIQERKKYFNNYKLECKSYNKLGSRTLTKSSAGATTKPALVCPSDSPDYFLHSVDYDVSWGKPKFPPVSYTCCRYVFESQ